MRIFTVSDIHIEYEENHRWLTSLSGMEYTEDLLLLGGDISDDIRLIAFALDELKRRFREVSFVPGNHELWVRKDRVDSLEKFNLILKICQELGVHTKAFAWDSTMIVPLLGWYDNTFVRGQEPDEDLVRVWMDFHCCKWPEGWDHLDAASGFLAMNDDSLRSYDLPVISFSHFVPRRDLIIQYIPEKYHGFCCVAGSSHIENQIRRLNSQVHLYGHSHLNQDDCVDGVRYINNAFGYPREALICRKGLLEVGGNGAQAPCYSR